MILKQEQGILVTIGNQIRRDKIQRPRKSMMGFIKQLAVLAVLFETGNVIRVMFFKRKIYVNNIYHSNVYNNFTFITFRNSAMPRR